MTRSAFTMKLRKGFEVEYKRRHDAIWPELSQLLTEDGVKEYYIYLDAPTGTLFAFMKKGQSNLTSPLSQHPVMRKWWDFMKDIMETHDDGSPVTTPLVEVFDLNV